MDKSCTSCKYEEIDSDIYPCKTCRYDDNWVPNDFTMGYMFEEMFNRLERLEEKIDDINDKIKLHGL